MKFTNPTSVSGVLAVRGDDVVVIDPNAFRGAPGEPGPKGEPATFDIRELVDFIGPPGVKGDVGPVGPQGESIIGPPGRDGVNGFDGQSGRDGKDGPRGPKGDPGRDGKDGRNGLDGSPGRDGLDGAPGKDGRNGIDAALPGGGIEGAILTFEGGHGIWKTHVLGGLGQRVRLNTIESRIASLEAGGGGSGVSSAYVQRYATSADVSSSNATLAQSSALIVTSLYAAATYQPKGFYTNSTDVSSFYALKTSLAGFANSSDVSSANATFAQSSALLVTSTYAAATYQPKGFYANSTDVSSFYALKTSLSGFANSSDVSSANATFAKSLDVAATYPTSAAVSSTYVGSTYVSSFYQLKTPAPMSIISSSQITPVGSCGQYEVTSLAAATTVNNPSGTPFDGQKLIVRIRDNGTRFGLTFTGSYRAQGGITLPTTTTALPRYIGCIYNSQDSFWDVVATT